jgi:hypothetical protein
MKKTRPGGGGGAKKTARLYDRANNCALPDSKSSPQRFSPLVARNGAVRISMAHGLRGGVGQSASGGSPAPPEDVSHLRQALSNDFNGACPVLRNSTRAADHKQFNRGVISRNGKQMKSFLGSYHEYYRLSSKGHVPR